MKTELKTVRLSDIKHIPGVPRDGREQVVQAHLKMMQAQAEGKPFESPGEYLGDIEIGQDFLLKHLTNINRFVSSIGDIPHQTYLLIADFDYDGDGHFMGLRLVPRIPEPVTESSKATGA
jgi:hypothetical protein